MPHLQHLPFSFYEWVSSVAHVPRHSRYEDEGKLLLVAVIAVNTIIERMYDLIMSLHGQGKDWGIENPVQRSDSKGFWKCFFQPSSNYTDHCGKCRAQLS